MCSLQQRGSAPDQAGRDTTCQFYDDEEDRQQIDEPERAERLDEGFEIEQADMAPTRFGSEGGGFEAELDRHPQHVKVSEVHDLAVEIGTPVAVDHEVEEQPGNRKKSGIRNGFAKATNACMKPV